MKYGMELCDERLDDLPLEKDVRTLLCREFRKDEDTPVGEEKAEKAEEGREDEIPERREDEAPERREDDEPPPPPAVPPPPPPPPAPPAMFGRAGGLKLHPPPMPYHDMISQSWYWQPFQN